MAHKPILHAFENLSSSEHQSKIEDRLVSLEAAEEDGDGNYPNVLTE